MSINETKIVICPHCQREQSVKIWQSLNVALDQEVKKELFEGKINLLVCENCQQKTFIPVPFLYIDPERQIAVHYFPTAVIRDQEFLRQFNIDGTYSGGESAGLEVPDYMRHLHIVFNMDELVTFIVFREVLFDFHRTGKVLLD